ncbi:MAG: hypothetical protein R3D29_07040 [Nitratireductor sp.]
MKASPSGVGRMEIADPIFVTPYKFHHRPVRPAAIERARNMRAVFLHEKVGAIRPPDKVVATGTIVPSDSAQPMNVPV